MQEFAKWALVGWAPIIGVIAVIARMKGDPEPVPPTPTPAVRVADTPNPAAITTHVTAPVAPAEPVCWIDWGKKVCNYENPVPPTIGPGRNAEVATKLEIKSRGCAPTYASYNRLRKGMSLATVQSIIGCEGVLEYAEKVGSEQYRMFVWREAGIEGYAPVITVMITRSGASVITQIGLDE